MATERSKSAPALTTLLKIAASELPRLRSDSTTCCIEAARAGDEGDEDLADRLAELDHRPHRVLHQRDAEAGRLLEDVADRLADGDQRLDALADDLERLVGQELEELAELPAELVDRPEDHDARVERHVEGGGEDVEHRRADALEALDDQPGDLVAGLDDLDQQLTDRLRTPP